jgi:O-antigen ligase
MNKSLGYRRQSNKTKINPQPNDKIFIGLLVIGFILPWPHGGEIMWQYLIFCIGVFSLSATYYLNSSNTQYNTNNNFLVLKNIKVPLVCLWAWLIFQLLQIVPLPLYLISNLSNVAEKNIIANNWQTISIAPHITLNEIIKHSSYVMVFILTLLLLNTKQRILNLANTLLFSSAIIGLYSLINYYTQGEYSIISSIPPWTAPWEKVAHGTFSYQNHYASFLTLTIPLGYGLLYANIKNETNQQTGSDNFAKIINLVMSINGLYLLSLLIMIIALFKTASRGGNAIFIISITMTSLCILFQQKKSKKEKVKKLGLGVISILIISLIILTTGITDSLSERITSKGYAPNGRDLMHQTAFSIIQERPLVGTGAGTYPVLQHKYKASELGPSAMSKRAHNDYLELLSNQGIIGFSLLGISTLLLVFKLFKQLKKNRSNKLKSLYGLQIASFCSVIAILLHSLADFNFHLPVNAVYFYFILALGLKIPQLREHT